MKIGFILRTDGHKKWGGDLSVINGLIRGLKSLNHESLTSTSPLSIPEADFFIFSNSTIEQRRPLEEMELMDRPFGVLGFQEDILHYYMPATGFCTFALSCLGYGFPTDNGMEFDLELLFEMPQIVHYYGEPPKRNTLYNYNLMRKAQLWIANSPTEAKTMQRDYPGCNTTVIPVPPGVVTDYQGTPDSSFLKFSGLSSKSYLLQVGRLEMRKNQIGTILATRHLDVPLVFISTLSPAYENAAFEAAATWRKAPTIFISESLEARTEGSARVIPMPQGQKLPASILLSAYYHAGLHIHPAFQELPGATYLEAARLGVPTVASSWCTITDYFFDPKLGHAELDGRILYCEPHHLKEIEQTVVKLFGKEFAPLEDHPTMLRTEKESAQDLITAIQNIEKH